MPLLQNPQWDHGAKFRSKYTRVFVWLSWAYSVVLIHIDAADGGSKTMKSVESQFLKQKQIKNYQVTCIDISGLGRGYGVR